MFTSTSAESSAAWVARRTQSAAPEITFHLFAASHAKHCLADVVRELKTESSAWIHRELRLAGFAWQEGYGGFTVSASQLEQVRAYVLNQEKHHRHTSFQEEYVALLKRGLVEYDERYLW